MCGGGRGVGGGGEGSALPLGGGGRYFPGGSVLLAGFIDILYILQLL